MDNYVKALLEARNIPDKDGLTASMIAQKYGFDECV
jgi:hypothetical protein